MTKQPLETAEGTEGDSADSAAAEGTSAGEMFEREPANSRQDEVASGAESVPAGSRELPSDHEYRKEENAARIHEDHDAGSAAKAFDERPRPPWMPEPNESTDAAAVGESTGEAQESENAAAELFEHEPRSNEGSVAVAESTDLHRAPPDSSRDSAPPSEQQSAGKAAERITNWQEGDPAVSSTDYGTGTHQIREQAERANVPEGETERPVRTVDPEGNVVGRGRVDIYEDLGNSEGVIMDFKSRDWSADAYASDAEVRSALRADRDQLYKYQGSPDTPDANYLAVEYQNRPSDPERVAKIEQFFRDEGISVIWEN